MKASIVSLVALLLVSCSSSHYYFTVEYQEPAGVTLPVDLYNVSVVNNMLQQPETIGMERTFDNHPVVGYLPDTDSLTVRLTVNTREALQNSDFFGDATISHTHNRRGSNWLEVQSLSDSLTNAVFLNPLFDGIISIDRFIYLLKMDAKSNMRAANLALPYAFLNIRLEGKVDCSIYSRNDLSQPLTQFNLSDTLYYNHSEYGDSTLLLKTIPEELLEILAFNMGEKIAAHLAPAWVTAERFVYSGTDSRMRQAFAYMENQRWEEAEALWREAYERTKKETAKARIASNIAIVRELNADLDGAYTWVLKSQEHIKAANIPAYADQSKDAQFLVEELQRRLKNKPILEKQLGITNDD